MILILLRDMLISVGFTVNFTEQFSDHLDTYFVMTV